MDPALGEGCRGEARRRRQRLAETDGPGGEGCDDGVEHVVRGGQVVPTPGKVQPGRRSGQAVQDQAQPFGLREAPSLVAAGVDPPALQ
jgi:hypothetical protein